MSNKEKERMITIEVVRTDGTKIEKRLPRSQLGPFVDGLVAGGFRSLTSKEEPPDSLPVPGKKTE